MRQKQRNKRIQLQYIDIREVLDELGIYYSEAGKNVSDGWIGVTCPFCSDESNHLGIKLGSGSISCFKCGTTGTIIKYLAEELNSFSKAIQILGDAVPKELRSFELEEKIRAIKVELPKEANRKITKYHAGYLKSRNYDYQELMDKYNLHFCGPIGKWANRIIVPVVKGYRLITFTSIDISDDTRIRYKHLSDEESVIPIKHYLFGIEHTNNHTIVITEGLFDMMRIGDGAVCGFGVKLTSEQIQLLSRFQNVIIAFDGDEAGRTAADKIANNLAAFCDVRILDLPEGKDPDKLSNDDIKYIRHLIGRN